MAVPKLVAINFFYSVQVVFYLFTSNIQILFWVATTTTHKTNSYTCAYDISTTYTTPSSTTNIKHVIFLHMKIKYADLFTCCCQHFIVQQFHFIIVCSIVPQHYHHYCISYTINNILRLSISI